MTQPQTPPSKGLLMSDTVDDDIKLLFQGIYTFITNHGYTNANCAGFVSPTGVTLTVNATLPDGSNYTYNQFVPTPPPPLSDKK